MNGLDANYSLLVGLTDLLPGLGDVGHSLLAGELLDELRVQLRSQLHSLTPSRPHIPRSSSIALSPGQPGQGSANNKKLSSSNYNNNINNYNYKKYNS